MDELFFVLFLFIPICFTLSVTFSQMKLCEKTVHGSHVEFVNEGLVDLDVRLSGGQPTNEQNLTIYNHQFQCITICYAGAVFTLRTIHKQRPINQILCHLETGHLKSFARDKAVRRWCRSSNIPIRELDQTGVTRCLKDRDDFSVNFKKFINQPMWSTPSQHQLVHMREHRLLSANNESIQLHGRCRSPMKPTDIQQIPEEHKGDRVERQYGGETKAFGMLHSFLTHRGANYSAGISSPNTSWTSCSRLSPYLTWGHISLRYVIVTTQRKQEELREHRKRNKSRGEAPSLWLRSLASFQSRMHWRSHFIQKLESQPSLEVQDQCLAFSHLRRQPGDFNESYYESWCEGKTGYPYVDACMRCLRHCGWINFRARAMLVSFATYNLWLDWKRIASYLARLFLDYEPGIHYPQLQMQSGVTGINAMRVYNVTKQGKDQDPNGVFIRKHVPELRNVPVEYIHEPFGMPVSVQTKCGVIIGYGGDSATAVEKTSLFQTKQYTPAETDIMLSDRECVYYPAPIVDEKAAAKAAKDKLSGVRKQQSTKEEAEEVYLKHGSRRTRGTADGAKPKALSSTAKRVKVDHGQTSITTSWKRADEESADNLGDYSEGDASRTDGVDNHVEKQPAIASQTSPAIEKVGSPTKSPTKASTITSFFAQKEKVSAVAKPTVRDEVDLSKEEEHNSSWSCNMCTYINEKPLALACSVCGSVRT